MAIDPKIERKIKALMSRAAGSANTHEADACRARALEIAARYGVEMSKLETEENNQVIRHDVAFSGAYTDMQCELLNALVRPLHCTMVCRKAPRSTRVKEAFLFGRTNHIDRVLMLYSLLSPQMIAGANTAYRQNCLEVTSAQIAKRSWMTGFIATINQRLEEIEKTVSEEYSRTDIHGNTQTGEVVLLDDLAKAKQLEREHFSRVRQAKHSRRAFHGGSYNGGREAGQRTDLGQTRVQHGMKAIG